MQILMGLVAVCIFAYILINTFTYHSGISIIWIILRGTSVLHVSLLFPLQYSLSVKVMPENCEFTLF